MNTGHDTALGAHPDIAGLGRSEPDRARQDPESAALSSARPAGAHLAGAHLAGAHLDLDRGLFERSFDREPFAFTHNLHALDAFGFDSLTALAKKFAGHPRDFFVSASAPAADSDFFSVPHGHHPLEEAMARLDSGRVRVLLKRPEDHDPRFRAILDQLYAQVLDLRGGMRGERLVRLESALFITSASATTPFHFDPEIAFFSQIEGEKVYHMYSPAVLGEPELEKFYLQGMVSIGQVPLEGRDPRHEHVFALRPGLGMHQPQNSPHWVETRAQRSISYSFVFETDATRAAGRTRAFNHYLRKVGLEPQHPGAHPAVDAFKAGSMRALIPIRRRAGRLLKTLRQG
jgi:hypothetical protein